MLSKSLADRARYLWDRTLAGRGEVLSPIHTGGGVETYGVRDSDLGETPIHDVLTVRRTVEPSFSDFGRRHGAGRNILADDAMRTVAGAFHTHRGAAAIASAMIQPIILRHFPR